MQFHLFFFADNLFIVYVYGVFSQQMLILKKMYHAIDIRRNIRLLSQKKTNANIEQDEFTSQGSTVTSYKQKQSNEKN